MRKMLFKIFMYSWVVTLPITVLGGYIAYNTLDRFFTYQVRLSMGGTLNLHMMGEYEFNSFFKKLRIQLMPAAEKITQLKELRLVVPEPELAKLESHMPQSGFNFVKAKLWLDDEFVEAKLKYRGDSWYRWVWDKKSMRVKTSKKTIYGNLRSFNLLAPRSQEQLNNYFSYKLGSQMGLLAPETDLVRVFINGEDRGFHTLVEQMGESTLRHSGRMPADIYRGEIIGKDGFVDGKIKTLFETPGVWDKVAVNNHYLEESNAPIAKMVSLISSSESEESQQELSRLFDMEAWGTFSAFESLTQSAHADDKHNWRIYYDPWRQKLVPMVWDTMAWFDYVRRYRKGKDKVRFLKDSNAFRKALYMNGDFLRARSRAFNRFFNSNSDEDFLHFVNESIALVNHEMQFDPFLNPPNPNVVSDYMQSLEQAIESAFSKIKHIKMGAGILPIYFHTPEGLKIQFWGMLTAQKIRLVFDRDIMTVPQSYAHFQTYNKERSTDITAAISVAGNNLTLDLEFVPGSYNLTFDTLDKTHRLTAVEVDFGRGWVSATSIELIKLKPFENMYRPVLEKPLIVPEIWQGEVLISGIREVEGPLVIKPGTVVRFEEAATLIIRNRLTAEGTKDQPIRFIPKIENQAPWGALVLIGQQANGSSLRHCEFSSGSGLKDDLFEYTAMFSVHHVDQVKVSHCVFQDSKIVDDMVHTIYSKIEFTHSKFLRAFSDAVDLDMSEVTIRDSHFENNGNDAIDLMTTKANITHSILVNNGDKGISVGENSQLFALNNLIKDNLVGVQVKDRSIGILYNQTLEGNNVAVDAFKKNWQYGTGGTAFVAKSTFSRNKENLTADKHSRIQVFDSFLPSPWPKKKRYTILNADEHSLRKAVKANQRPDNDLLSPIVADALELMFGNNDLAIEKNRRGALIR